MEIRDPAQLSQLLLFGIVAVFMGTGKRFEKPDNGAGGMGTSPQDRGREGSRREGCFQMVFTSRLCPGSVIINSA